MTTAVRNANRLMQDIDKKIANWNERSMFTLKGVRNLSMSDLETLYLYAETYADYGHFNGYMSPVGGVKDVLTAYGIKESTSYNMWG